MTQLAGKLKTQLKCYLTEMMAIARNIKDVKKLEQLKENDRILSQYMLEEESRQSVFDWIREFKDFEIREELKKQINSLNKQLK